LHAPFTKVKETWYRMCIAGSIDTQARGTQPPDGEVY
jgi:hypothetical protein